MSNLLVFSCLFNQIGIKKESEKFELSRLRSRFCFFGTMKHLDIGELFISDAHDGYMTIVWQVVFNSLRVNLGILHAGTMADIHRELEHAESVFLEMFAEFCIFALVPNGLRWQIKKHQDPHDAIFTKPIH